MDDYFAECDEHLGAIRRLLLDAGGIDRPPAEPRGARGALPQLSLDQGHFGDGRAARGGDARAPHGEPSACLRQRDVVVEAAAVDALIRGVNALERTIAARRTGQPAPASAEAIALIEAAIQDGYAVSGPRGRGAVRRLSSPRGV